MSVLDQRITENVRGALNGDEESLKRVNLLLQLPFKAIDRAMPSKDEETRCVKIILAGMKSEDNDRDAIEHLRNEKMADLLEKRPKQLAIK